MIMLFHILPCYSNDTISSCDSGATTCEFFLEAGLRLPMRKGVGQKVYINETDGKLYLYGQQNTEQDMYVNPDDVVLADGSSHERVLFLFNKTMPGPTLTVYKDQEIIVHVKNNLINDGLTVHFHGIEMRNTPWMDGAAFVTQCPILPGQSFTYKFRPNRKGTYFYHSHLGTQVNMGLFGAFIVKEKELDQHEEHIMIVQDYNNRYAADDTYARMLFHYISPDGVPSAPAMKIDKSFDSIAEIKSSLINGRGRVYDVEGNKITHTPLTVFNVEKGRQYKIRVIGAGFSVQHIISIDGHKMQLVALDGHDVKPVIADSFIMSNGERFDFLIEANSTIDNYWIRAKTLQHGEQLIGYGILRYDGANETDPISTNEACSSSKKCTVVNCPFETHPEWNCIHLDKMPPKNNDPAPASNVSNFKEFFVNIGYALRQDGAVIGHMNGVSLQLPSVSAMTQPKEVNNICNESDDCRPDKVCFCLKPYDVNFGDVVQITFISRGFLNIVHHPVHVHGYSVHVLKIGYRRTNASFDNLGDNTDIDCPPGLCYSNATWADKSWYGGNIPGIDLSRVPRKDTFTVPAGGYAIVRFVADNPGLWYIHCHQEFHSQVGK